MQAIHGNTYRKDEVSMAKSVIKSDSDDRCYFCGRYPVEVHHIFKGKNRQISDREGFIVHLCPYCHTMNTDSVHGKEGHLKDLHLMKACQLAYEENHSRAEFMALIGRNYIEEDED